MGDVTFPDIDIDGVNEAWKDAELAHAEPVDGGWQWVCPTCGEEGEVREDRLLVMQDATVHHYQHVLPAPAS